MEEIIIQLKAFITPHLTTIGEYKTAVLGFAKEYEFLGAGLIMGTVAAVWNPIKRIPSQIMSIIDKQFTMEITINKCDSPFHELIQWYDDQGFGKHARTLRLSSQHGKYGGEYEHKLSAGFGHHWFWMGIRPFKLIRIREQDQGTDKVKEQITIRTWGRSQAPIRKLISEACPIKAPKERKPRLYKFGNYDWERVEEIEDRPEHTVNLPKDTKEKIFGHIETFVNNKEWYLENGLKHRTGICLYGPPGTGKTSLARVLASKYHKDLYYLSLANMTDKSLQTAMDAVGESGIILIEDIDSFKSVKSRDNEEDTGSITGFLTLSGILNVLDGIKSCDERLIITTTNRIEALDSAILRPGRIDLKIELTYLTDEVFREMMKRFYPEFSYSKKFVLNDNVSPAEVENAIIEYRTEPDKVLRKFTQNIIIKEVK